jgi:hypothetical protein
VPLFKPYVHMHCNRKVILFWLPSLVVVDPYITDMYQHKTANQEVKGVASDDFNHAKRQFNFN